jgi:hypothetical protein
MFPGGKKAKNEDDDDDGEGEADPAPSKSSPFAALAVDSLVFIIFVRINLTKRSTFLCSRRRTFCDTLTCT